MKAQILKIAGVKNEKEFYKKFPTEEAFMKKHGKELKKAQGGASVNGADFFGNTTSNYGYDPNASNSFVEAVGKAKGGGKGKSGDLSGMLGKLAPLAGTLIGGIQDINQTNQDIKKMKGYADISDVVAKAAKTRPDSVKKKIDYNSMRSQTVNPLGVGTNYLAAKNGAEIQNTYDPLDIYEGLGYEPLNDSNVKQFQNGGFAASPYSNFAGIASGLAGNLGSAMGKGTGRGGQFAQTLGAIGSAASLIPGVGTVAGIALNTLPSLVGGLLDSGQQNELQMAQDKLTRNLGAATLTSGAQSFQGQNSSFMEDGGWVSNDWMPQVITKFGDYNMDELLAPPHDADMLRAGGHLKEYTPPSARAMFTGRRDLPYEMEDGGDLPSTNMMFDTDRYPSAKYGTSMAMGGDLRTTWGGEAEPISYNPYLPGTGETVMFRGQSHDETNSNGQSGIGVKYGTGGMMDYAEYGSETPSADVEVERNEPAAVLKDPETGGDNLVVYGNMVIPNYGVEELGDPKAKGKKFKNYIADLSKVEARQNKIIDKSTSMVDSMDVVTSFDKLALQSAQANIMGATAKLKNIADKKVLAAGVQNAILDTAKEHGIVADDLAKGKIVKDKEAMKEARFGAKMETAQKGMTVAKFIKDIPFAERKAMAIANGIKNFRGTAAQNQKLIDLTSQTASAPAESVVSPMTAAASNTPSFFGNTGTAQQANLSPSDLDQYIPQGYPGSPSVVESPNKKAVKKELADSPWFDIANTALQSAYPFIRSTSQQPLDPSQIGPEMMALGLNALEPVQLNLYNPTPQAQPYRISLQDKRNEVIAQQQAASKASYGNPAAQAMIAAQAARALSDISGEENRMNLAETMRAAEANRALMNEAQRVNIGLYDQQYARQTEAKSKTKTQAIEIAKSVAEKMQQNKLENRKQAIMENMYPAFSFTKSGIAYKDPRYTTTFNPYGSSKKSDANIPEGFEPTYKKDETGNYVLDKLEKKKVSRNGAIVKAIKGL